MIKESTSFLGMPEGFKTTNAKGSKAYSVKDIAVALSATAPLLRLFTKDEAVIAPDTYKGSLKYYLLGVDLSGFKFDVGYTYTLLIDRYKKRERSGRLRESGFYHEKNPIQNKRVNEVVLNPSHPKAFIDFKQDMYFAGANGELKDKKKIRLGFRIRITDSLGNSVETSHLAFTRMMLTLNKTKKGNSKTICYKF